MYGISLLPALSALWFLVAGAVGVFIFLRWEARLQCPVFNVTVFRHNTVFTFSNLAALINYAATFAVGFLLSLYLQYTKGLSPQDAGLILISQPVIMAILSPFTGRLSDRMEPRIMATIGMAVTFVSLVFFIFLSAETTLTYIIIGLAILGTGFGIFSSPNTNAVMSSVDKRFYGVCSATLGTMRLTGNMLSMGIVMLIFATYIGRVQITPEYYPLFVKSVKVAFTVFAVVCFGGIFASLARGKMR
jgi:MFS family permease